MKTISFVLKRDVNGRFGKRRAIELYHEDSPFKPRREEPKTAYRRREKHVKKMLQEY